MTKNALQIAITILLVGCAPNDRPATETNDAPPVDAADTVYTNGKIYTVNEDQPWAEAVAIKMVGLSMSATMLASHNSSVLPHKKLSLQVGLLSLASLMVIPIPDTMVRNALGRCSPKRTQKTF